jgi:myo-inositol-1(or 4)-monophosphatase
MGVFQQPARGFEMWDKELDVARHASREAGKILTARFGRVNHIAKKGEIDLVTEADLEAETVIVDIIRSHFPQDGILAEESGEDARDTAREWLIDPLDGTTNFAHGFPFFAVSIALQVAGEGVLGIVSNPCLGEHFEALKGAGAFLNQKPIRVSQAKDLQESLLAVGFPYTIRENPQRVMDHLKKMVTRAQGIRRPGSASIDLAYVAAGKIDGFWEEGLKPWDTAAGMVIVKEAGGMVSDYQGRPFSPFMNTVVASNSRIHEAILSVLNS